jgi:hypothetical protein
MSGFEVQTLFAAVAATGYQIKFSGGKWIATVSSKTGTFWVKPHSAAETVGAAPIAIPGTAGTVVAGWARVQDGDSLTFGVDSRSSQDEGSAGLNVKLDQILYFDVWCEVTGDLIATGH